MDCGKKKSVKFHSEKKKKFLKTIKFKIALKYFFQASNRNTTFSK